VGQGPDLMDELPLQLWISMLRLKQPARLCVNAVNYFVWYAYSLHIYGAVSQLYLLVVFFSNGNVEYACKSGGQITECCTLLFMKHQITK